jgi:hypothetical protein
VHQHRCTLALLLQAARHRQYMHIYPHPSMAGPAINPVQGFRTKRELHWEFLRLWTGFELSSSCADLP